jgi:hypothetical protein
MFTHYLNIILVCLKQVMLLQNMVRRLLRIINTHRTAVLRIRTHTSPCKPVRIRRLLFIRNTPLQQYYYVYAPTHTIQNSTYT